ncbi:MAG: thioesterase [Termitinemataceae bacterium]|nr:MAG: thioesterase [Termitinemataceae bacterium]
MDVFEKQYTVTVGDVDKTESAKPSYIFDIFQELTTVHGSDLGIGINEIKSLGMGWVLSRFSVEILRRPKFGETFIASTWPRGPNKLFMLRDYLIKDSSDNVIVRSRSRWIVIDIEKRSPMRPDSLPLALPLNEGRDALVNDGAALKKHEGLEKKCSRTAVYSDVDFNGHVNNARYIQWVQDACPPALIENAAKLSVEINYIIEIKIGESIDIFCGCLENSDGKLLAFEGVKSDGQTAFRCEIHF